ncbi:MAG: HAMP domain-containing protein [Proteobacteria bacterium]|nr:HAMP domain-containing protein [Pseudomonadota bacterium]
MKSSIAFSRRISVKITALVLLILSVGIGFTILYYSLTQNRTLIETRFDAIKEESEVLFAAIKNNMLAGDAPVTVQLFKDLSRIRSEIKLYRADGVSAFSDNNTLVTVNSNLGMQRFRPKETFSEREVNSSKDFKQSVKTSSDIFISDIRPESKQVIIYKPLFNQPRCSACHGMDHLIRGVITISTSVDEVYEKSQRNTILSIMIFGLVVLVLSISIMLFLHRFVIKRVFKIGNVVEGVGQGNFRTKIKIQQPDEIGVLAQQINDMIDGVAERFKLTKFVSKSTLDHIKKSEEISLGGEKKVMTVLFSDIRGFTSFSEKRDPAEVMTVLNEVMNLQADIVAEFDGDIDKYVGDELMAVFEGKDMIMRAVKCAEKIVRTIQKAYTESGESVQVGIGINTGELIAGNMGSGDRMDRTVIGDTVNLGARLCSIAGKNVVVLSEYSYELIKNNVRVRKHKPIKVKGKSKPVEIYTLRKTL